MELTKILPCATAPTGRLDWSESLGSLAPQPVSTFDAQAHRGGPGLFTESTTLNLEQVKTMDCETQQLAGYPEQQTVPGATMRTLNEVLTLVKAYNAPDLKLNIETKVEAGAPHETAPREQFVSVVLDTIRSAGMMDSVTIQSFDWGSLMLTLELAPSVPVVALANGDFLQGGKVSDPGFTLYPTAGMIESAHARGIKVIPWTVDDPATMHALIDLGVDGIITDFPDRLPRPTSRRSDRARPGSARVGCQEGADIAMGPRGTTRAHRRCSSKLLFVNGFRT
ncbi:glycerophosphodiester phosphodiesterase family protein [Rhodococcus sp. IEGM 1379]|uniref:glycerophosphodiester phosphodiesterase family protein n=1 Tax=Rhodococcus sp. IEGM 1379 TaxID=3047086 RepID=UPI0024B7303E|nr:glycerophosphodiester phosphodiesterase family protein [Rhodococcus sp. IEGM 1379]MDI9919157.1 glycerophosphodiester phosphodiesterase family protein [Rhodococcus sp. IEGM 1379]